MSFTDIPGKLTEADAAELAELCRGKRTLQVGAYCGRASVVIAKACKRLWLCDSFMDYPWSDLVVEELMGNLRTAGVADQVETNFRRFPDRVDVVYIDRDWSGDLDAVMAEVKARYPGATVCTGGD